MVVSTSCMEPATVVGLVGTQRVDRYSITEFFQNQFSCSEGICRNFSEEAGNQFIDRVGPSPVCEAKPLNGHHDLAYTQERLDTEKGPTRRCVSGR